MSGSLDHARIRKLFDELSTALEARGVRGHVYLPGGSALIAGHGKERATKDVDVRIDAATDEVLAAAKTIGKRHGLDERWFDLKAAQFVPRGDDVRAKTVYNSPGLVVTGASAEHLLAMKVFAARDIDLQDVKHLAGVLGITKASDAIRICEQAYPASLAWRRRSSGCASPARIAANCRPARSRASRSDSSATRARVARCFCPENGFSNPASRRGFDLRTYRARACKGEIRVVRQFVISRSAVRVRSPAPIESITYRDMQPGGVGLCQHHVPPSRPSVSITPRGRPPATTCRSSAPSPDRLLRLADQREAFGSDVSRPLKRGPAIRGHRCVSSRRSSRRCRPVRSRASVRAVPRRRHRRRTPPRGAQPGLQECAPLYGADSWSGRAKT